MHPQSKNELLSRIHQSFSIMIDMVATLDPGQWLESMEGDDWRIKDIVAHVIAWEDVLIRFHIRAEPFDQVIGMEGAQYWVISDNEINEHFYQRARDWPVEKVLELAEETHDTLIQILEELPDDRLREPPPHSKGEPQSQSLLLNYVVGNTYDHYEEHLATIQKIVSQMKE
jgi:hypothetical protein